MAHQPEDRPNLDTLPAELVHEIFSHVERHQSRLSYWEPGYTLKATRLVNKSLYMKTLYIFTKYRSKFFPEATFRPTQAELLMLLHFTSIPYVRDRLEAITLGQKSILEWCGWLCDQTRTPGPYHSGPIQNEVDEMEYEESPEIYHLLKAIFNNLSKASSLHTIRFDFLSNAALKAFQENSIEKEIGVLTIYPWVVKQHFTATTWNSIPEYTKKLRGVHIDRTYRHSGCPPIKNDHYKGAVYTTPGLTNLLRSVRSVTELSIDGCADPEYVPLHRFCDGCADLWNNNFRFTRYSHLKSLRLRNVFINSSSLNEFLKNHALLLVEVDFQDVYLTSGPWRKILTTLQSLPLSKVSFANIGQKRAEGTGPQEPLLIRRAAQVSGSKVTAFLDLLLKNTYVCTYRWPYKLVDLEVMEGLEGNVPRQMDEPLWLPTGLYQARNTSPEPSEPW